MHLVSLVSAFARLSESGYAAIALKRWSKFGFAESESKDAVGRNLPRANRVSNVAGAAPEPHRVTCLNSGVTTVVFSDSWSNDASEAAAPPNDDASTSGFPGAVVRTFIFSMVALLAVLLFRLDTASAEPVTLRVGHFPNVTHIQALVARDFERLNKGWFEQRLGPDVKIEWYVYNAGPSAMEALFTNALDLTYVGPSPALNAYVRSRGEEVRVIAGAVDGGSALVVQPDSTLKNAADFRGKRIATPQFGNTQDVAARAWLTAGGLRVTQTGGDAQVIPTENPDQLALFKSRQLDAVWTVEPWVSRLEQEAGGRILVDDRNAVTTVLVSSAKFLREHRDLATRFAAAHRELTDWINQHPDEAKRMVRDELSAILHAELPSDLTDRAFGRMRVTSETSLDEFKLWVADAQKVGFIRNAPDLSHFVETLKQ
jgi:NitT/TauT family transport system substrate-binding protein